jgi:hypothetical protein
MLEIDKSSRITDLFALFLLTIGLLLLSLEMVVSFLNLLILVLFSSGLLEAERDLDLSRSYIEEYPAA